MLVRDKFKRYSLCFDNVCMIILIVMCSLKILMMKSVFILLLFLIFVGCRHLQLQKEDQSVATDVMFLYGGRLGI